jgi:predicted methyltransferase
VIVTKLELDKIFSSKNFFILFILFFSFSLSADPLQKAVNNEFRDVKNTSRDIYRNPYETLSFFELEPSMTVVELSEILASYLDNSGTLIAAHFDRNTSNTYLKKSRINFEKKISSEEIYNKVKIVDLTSKLSEPGSVDAVLTFRNLHNWLGPMMDKVFLNTFVALKSGGIFGIVEHRALKGTSMKDMKKSGYVTEDHAIEVAEKHGFKLVSRSEINANPKDTKNHPKGVWTLPPSLRLKEKNQDKYIAIGESDRMTLLFKKP